MSSQLMAPLPPLAPSPPSPPSPALAPLPGLAPLPARPTREESPGRRDGEPRAVVPFPFRRVPISAVSAFPVASPLRLVPEPTRAPAPTWAPGRGAPLRLTRRGRLAVRVAAIVGVLAAVAVSVLLVVAAHAGAVSARPPGSATGAGAAGAAGAHVIVVQPGDTLWGIAQRAAPGADPRVTIERIVRLNGLDRVDGAGGAAGAAGGALQPGQRLALPS